MLSTAPPLLELELELLLPLELLVLPPELLLVPPPELLVLPPELLELELVAPPELELLLELPDLGSSVPVDSPQAETAMAEAIANDKHSALRQPVFLFIVISTRRTTFLVRASSGQWTPPRLYPATAQLHLPRENCPNLGW